MLKVKQYLLGTVSVLILFAASLQSQTFTASVNSTTVGQNEPFQISFQFNGEGINSIKNFKAPDFKGLRILSGPNQSTSMQIINGAVSGSVTYSYYVQASNLGALIIGAASLDYKGKTFHSQPVKLTVIKGQAPQNNTQGGQQQRQQSALGDNVFLKVEADRQKVYTGEQVTVTY
ncbi:MAG: BatD family protein, partial [Ignavibacteriota bacterium]